MKKYQSACKSLRRNQLNKLINKIKDSKPVFQEEEAESKKRKLNMYDFDKECAQTYKEKCVCGKEIEVSTQQDGCPEYYTEIYVKCTCGKSVNFSLPVN